LKNSYNEDSIQKLDPLSFTRLRPDTYCGSTEDSTQLWQEIVLNCTDEFLAGNCDEVVMTIDDNNVISVSDNGQGIIPNVKKDGDRTILEMVYGDINTSGKYDKSEDAVYKVSTGAFGIGSSLTNFLSHWLIATTKRNGEFETVYFKEGKFDRRESGECDKDEHGVTVTFRPSEEFFKDPKPSRSKINENLLNISCVCNGLTLYFNGKKFYNPDGLSDLLKRKIGNDIQIISTPFVMDKEIGNQRLVLAMSFGTKSTTDFYSFCNYSPIEAGTPISAIKSCITRTLNKWGQENKLLKEKETLPGSALQEGISVVFNLISPNIRYDSQTKVRVTSTEDNSFINSVLSEEFELWLDQNPKFGESIIESALIARKAAEAAKKARAAVKNKAAEKKEKAFKMPTKLTDCWTKDRSKCELFLAEGLSAASGLVEARSSEFQAIYGLRGKCLSVLKTTPEKILANQEINNLIQALGLDCDTKTAKLTYDKDKLRYGKIIASADADFDGYAIENLIFNILWYLCPELIINGHVYSAVPPLFRVTTKKNEYIYLRDANALEDYKKEHANEIAVIGRMKGLGEQDSDELSYALLDPETRHIVQLKVTDFEKTDALFEDLYGKKVEPRVKFLLEHGEEANVD
jgi:DNA gyrase subunit B